MIFHLAYLCLYVLAYKYASVFDFATAFVFYTCRIIILMEFMFLAQICRELVADLNYATTTLPFPSNIMAHDDILGLLPRDKHSPIPIKYEIISIMSIVSAMIVAIHIDEVAARL